MSISLTFFEGREDWRGGDVDDFKGRKRPDVVFYAEARCWRLNERGHLMSGS